MKNVPGRPSDLKRPKLCIVSPYSYPLFNPECKSPFGGSEVRISLIAKELAKRGNFDVSMVVFDHGQPNGEQRDGITFYAHTGYFLSLNLGPPEPADAPQPEAEAAIQSAEQQVLPLWKRAGYRLYFELHRPAASAPAAVRKYVLLHKFYKLSYRIFRFGSELGWRVLIKIYFLLLRLKWRILTWKYKLQLWLNSYGRIGRYIIAKEKVAVYTQVAADIYLFAGQGNIAAELAHFCKKQKKKYIFLAGSDLNYNPSYKEKPRESDPYGSIGYLATYAIENADWHIVQSPRQAELLQKHYGRSGTVIRNPIDLHRTYPKQEKANVILWVGKSDRVKRPEIILDLARHCSKYHYVIIMNFSHPDIYEQSIEKARQLSNVTMLHYVPFDEIENYFAQARLFVNTSVLEGFPNTFLQAAKYGVPIVSYQVDPGKMITQHGCGALCNGNFELLKEHIQRLMNDLALYQQKSKMCLDYVRTYHDKDKLLDQFEQLLISIYNGQDLNKYTGNFK